MWTANKITADAANKLQVGAGLLLKNFSTEAPKEPADEDIICETTGDFHITCTPEWQDLFEGVNNAKMNTKEGKRIKSWNCALTVSSLSVSESTLKAALGAADGGIATGIRGRQITGTDFQALYWIGDLQDEKQLFLVEMSDAVNTSGIDFTATNDGKGAFALNIVPHVTLKDQDKVPMGFYILTKQDGGMGA